MTGSKTGRCTAPMDALFPSKMERIGWSLFTPSLKVIIFEINCKEPKCVNEERIKLQKYLSNYTLRDYKNVY